MRILHSQQQSAAVLAVVCLALLSCRLFPPSAGPLSTAAAWLGHSMQQLQDTLPQHTALSAHLPRHNDQQQQQAGRTFTIENDRFVLDGQPVQLLSGSIHYFRTHPQQWRERLSAIKAMGLNAIQLYVPWNFHQPNTPGPQGVLSFDGWRDLPGFISLAHELGLLVLVRPGPYSCGEWEFGGLPAWLLQQNASMVLRSSDPQFLAAVDDWWGVLLPALAPLTVDKGGPIVMVQIENEYGYYGHDKVYLRHLVGLVRQHMGQGVVLYTVDGASLLPVVRGTLPGGEVLTTVDFGPTTDVKAAFELQARFNPPGKSPPFCVEYYTGWLTHWGEPMANTSTKLMVDTLAEILAANGGTGNVNLYMAAGGTNFGPWSGANLFEVPLIGSALQQQPHQVHTTAAAAAAAASVGAGSDASIPASIIALLRGQLGKPPAAAAAAASGNDASIHVPGPEVWRLRQAAMQLQQQQEQQQHGVVLTAHTSQPSSSSSSSSVTSANYEIYSPHITSYDYHCPLGEAGTVGQIGVGGPNKFEAIQQLLLQKTQPQTASDTTAGRRPPSAAATAAQGVPAEMPQVSLVSYGDVTLSEGLYLTDALDPLSETCRGSTYVSSSLDGYTPKSTAAAAAVGPVTSQSEYPLAMEMYGQYYGLIVYSTMLGPECNTGGLLQLRGHDSTWVYLDGQLLGHTYRSSPAHIHIPVAPFGSSSSKEDVLVAESRRKLTASTGSSSGSSSSSSSSNAGRLLQLLVWQLGRNNFALAFGGQLADPKGVIGNVTVAGRVLREWKVHHVCMENGTAGSSDLPWRPLVPLMQEADTTAAATAAAAATAPSTAWTSSRRNKPRGSSSSSSNDAQHRPFIHSSADAQAQAMIAAAAEAATGSGPATAAARGIATIRAGIAAAANNSNSGSSNSGNSGYKGRGALLLRGTLNIPSPPAADTASTTSSSSRSSSSRSSSSSSSSNPTPASTFLHLGGWGRGEVWVNGNSLGRYWPGQGPQMTLYVPGPFLKPGPNEVLVLELEGRVPVGPGGEGAGGHLPSVATVTAPDFSGPPGGVEPL